MKSTRVLGKWRGIQASTIPSVRTFSHTYPISAAANKVTDSNTEVPDVPVSAKSSTLGNLKRGKGGRSSFSGIVATVFGSSGFLGNIVVNELGKMGSQVVVAHRCDPYDVRDMKVTGDLGQILYHQIDLRDEDSIKRSLKYSNVAINVIGRDYETKNFSFEDVHVAGARRLARLSREAGVERFIHVSALNACEHPKPTVIPWGKGSKWLASKWRGEQAVREEFPDAIIFRPSDMFGLEDRFLNYYRRFRRRHWGYMPLWKRGKATVKQPIYSGDVARGIVAAISHPNAPGKTYDCVGRKRYELGELVDWMFRILRMTPDIYQYTRGVLDPLTLIKHFCSSVFTYKGSTMSWQRMEREYVTDHRTLGNPDLDDLGIVKLTPLEDYAPHALLNFRYWNYYGDDLGDFPDAGIPPWMPDEKEQPLIDLPWEEYTRRQSLRMNFRPTY